ncbi:glycosyltransferase family 2 protein [Trichloromonas sp.]|uniref:glycosyltransferase family 2 protein n=1 Tax=Trichloromonas sp. TaxID=3069249 RepID=UPI002A473342|nr:glycosyltransferase family 2 protein [Trichloromonas sp.]
MLDRVSISLATYNGAEFLPEQLASYIDQTRRPDELVVCDDCSTDGTVGIVKDFARSAPFAVRIYENSFNQGYVRNFSRALSLCTGDVVFLSDQDDVWHRDKIAKMLAYFDANPEVQLLIHDVLFCRKDLSSIGQTKIERMTGVYDLQTQYVVGMATAIRASFLRICLPVPDEDGLTHDLWLHRCAVAVNRKGVVHDVLAFYRRHGANATTHALNSEFATTRKQLKRNFPGTLSCMTSARIIGSTDLTALSRWLQTNKAALVGRGFCLEEQVEGLVARDMVRASCSRERLEILSRPRWHRPLKVLRFYMKGGYGYFVGWKSAAKDLLIR